MKSNNNKIVATIDTKNKRGGRPPKSDSEKKQKIVKISLSASEHRFLSEHAKNSGCTQLARFIRECIVETVKNGKFSYIQQHEISLDLTRELYAIGNNLNQIAHHLNSGKAVNEHTHRRLSDDLQMLRDLFIKCFYAIRDGEAKVATIEVENENGNS